MKAAALVALCAFAMLADAQSVPLNQDNLEDCYKINPDGSLGIQPHCQHLLKGDKNGDGVDDALEDKDGDKIADLLEDDDNDGTANYFDSDSELFGGAEEKAAPVDDDDFDNDGILNADDDDDDNDGILDADDDDDDNDGIADDIDNDDDNDGVLDVDEKDQHSFEF